MGGGGDEGVDVCGTGDDGGVVALGSGAAGVRGCSALLGRQRGGGARVGEDGGWVGVIGLATGKSRKGHVEPVVGGGLVGVDDNVVALADAEEDVGASDGSDGDHVGCNYLEAVADETNGKGVLEGGVDEAQEMLLALGEGLASVGAAGAVRVDVAAVEEDVVTGGRRAGEVGNEWVAGVVNSVGDLKDRTVIPVG